MNPVPEECTTNKPKDEVLELGKASCYYKLMMIESFYVPSIYCSIRYMLLPNLKIIDSMSINLEETSSLFRRQTIHQDEYQKRSLAL